jgi:hypothetical protein
MTGRWSKVAKNFTIFFIDSFTGGEGVAGFAWTRHDWARLTWTDSDWSGGSWSIGVLERKDWVYGVHEKNTLESFRNL